MNAKWDRLAWKEVNKCSSVCSTMSVTLKAPKRHKQLTLLTSRNPPPFTHQDTTLASRYQVFKCTSSKIERRTYVDIQLKLIKFFNERIVDFLLDEEEVKEDLFFKKRHPRKTAINLNLYRVLHHIHKDLQGQPDQYIMEAHPLDIPCHAILIAVIQ